MAVVELEGVRNQYLNLITRQAEKPGPDVVGEVFGVVESHGDGMGSEWGQCGVGAGSVWDRCGVSVHQCGVGLGSEWGSVLGSHELNITFDAPADIALQRIDNAGVGLNVPGRGQKTG